MKPAWAQLAGGKRQSASHQTENTKKVDQRMTVGAQLAARWGVTGNTNPATSSSPRHSIRKLSLPPEHLSQLGTQNIQRPGALRNHLAAAIWAGIKVIKPRDSAIAYGVRNGVLPVAGGANKCMWRNRCGHPEFLDHRSRTNAASIG